jgi:hypothetical protein
MLGTPARPLVPSVPLASGVKAVGVSRVIIQWTRAISRRQGPPKGGLRVSTAGKVCALVLERVRYSLPPRGTEPLGYELDRL